MRTEGLTYAGHAQSLSKPAKSRVIAQIQEPVFKWLYDIANRDQTWKQREYDAKISGVRGLCRENRAGRI